MAGTTLNERVAIACGGFLLAVLWFDLMFDVQLLGYGSGPAPGEVIDSIAGYYARVTIEASPMSRLVGVVMLVLWMSVARQLWRGDLALGLRLVLGFCAFFPTGLALLRIVPNAVALGARSGTLAAQSDLARSIFYEHVLCLALIAIFLGCELTLGWTSRARPAEPLAPEV